MQKNELLYLARHQKKPKEYIVDRLLQQNGHDVLRLPHYHCQFNAIELIWANPKTYCNKHIGEEGYGDDKVLHMREQSLSNCNANT